jgi:hypothetical protein
MGEYSKVKEANSGENKIGNNGRKEREKGRPTLNDNVQDLQRYHTSKPMHRTECFPDGSLH